MYLTSGGTWVHVVIGASLPMLLLYLGTCYDYKDLKVLIGFGTHFEVYCERGDLIVHALRTLLEF